MADVSTMAAVTARVAEKYGFSASQIRGAVRKRGLIGVARQEAMALCFEIGRSNGQIAVYFGCTDHTTVVHARAKFAERQAAVRLAA